MSDFALSVGDDIRVRLTPAKFRLSVPESDRIARVIGVRDVVEKPISCYKRWPDRERNGTCLVSCYDMVRGTKFSFYNGNAVRLEKLSWWKAVILQLWQRIGRRISRAC